MTLKAYASSTSVSSGSSYIYIFFFCNLNLTYSVYTVEPAMSSHSYGQPTSYTWEAVIVIYFVFILCRRVVVELLCVHIMWKVVGNGSALPTWCFGLILAWCWTTVYNVGPASTWHQFDEWCLLSRLTVSVV